MSYTTAKIFPDHFYVQKWSIYFQMRLKNKKKNHGDLANSELWVLNWAHHICGGDDDDNGMRWGGGGGGSILVHPL